MKSQKFLVTLLEDMTHKHFFIGIWIIMFFGFAYLFIQFQKKRDQRNFREGGDAYRHPSTPKLTGDDGKNLPQKRDNSLPRNK